MNEMRQKDQADFDLETFVDLFDTAMTSDNPAVRKAFKNLVLISAIVNSDSSRGLRQGPLRRLVEDIQHLNKRISQLETVRQNPNNVPIPSGPYINTPYIISTPGTATPMPTVQPHTGTPNWPPGTINCNASSVLEKLETK